MVYSVSGIIADLDSMSGEIIRILSGVTSMPLHYSYECNCLSVGVILTSLFYKAEPATSAVQASCSGETSELTVTGPGGKRRNVKRTKGGLLPWWVRKRLQESSEPALNASLDQGSTPKRLHTSVEVLPPRLLSNTSCILILERAGTACTARVSA